jgi:hypothetical protein
MVLGNNRFRAVTAGPIVMLIPWNDRNLTGISLLPVVVLDYAFIYGTLKVVEKTMMRSDGAKS